MIEKWYYSRHLKPQGPLEREEIRAMIRSGEIGPQEFICLDGQEWKAADKYFEAALFPAFQEIAFQDSGAAEWVVLLLAEGSREYRQEGPLTIQQVKQLILAGEISWESPIWKAGLKGWAKIADRPEFSQSV